MFTIHYIIWGAVQCYQVDSLADDEKQLHRADKEAKRVFEESETYKKKIRGGGWGVIQPLCLPESGLL